MLGILPYISGVIPESISRLGNLERLLLSNTDLSGLIPSSMGNLTKLISFDAHMMPTWRGQFQKAWGIWKICYSLIYQGIA
jgi:hypothetical protein